MIYMIRSKVSGKRYIGKTKHSMEYRWKQHCYKARSKPTSYLHKAINHYGPDQFELFCLSSDNENLNELEQFWINQLEPEYNHTKGGDGGDTSKSPAYIKAMLLRNTFGSNNSMYGLKGPLNPNYGQVRGSSLKQKEGVQKAWNNNVDRKQLASQRAKGNKNGYSNKKQSRPITVDGIRYNSIGQAVIGTGLSWHHVKKRGILDE